MQGSPNTSTEPAPAFENSAPAADITVERYLYRESSTGVEINAVLREPDGSLRISDGWGHYFLDPALARWLQQDDTVLTWQQIPSQRGMLLALCLVDKAGSMLWRESLPIATVTPPPDVSYDYGGPALGLASRLRRQSLTSPSGSHTLLHHHDGCGAASCSR